MKLKFTLKKGLLLFGIISFFSFILNGQTSATLRYVSGFCNKVVIIISNSPPKVYPQDGNQTTFCLVDNSVHRIGDIDEEKDIFIYQLQQRINGSWVDQNDFHSTDDINVEYRDLQYGETYRVKILVRTGNGIQVWHPNVACLLPLGELPGPEVTIFTNPLDIESYNNLTDADLSGILDNDDNWGGNGTSFSQRKKFCQADVQDDIPYDISGTHGPDHWVINLSRTNMTGGYAGGDWHNYIPAQFTGSVDVFGEGWLSKYGSNSIWPGQYKVSMNGYQDCDNAPWAYHEDFFEIVSAGTSGTPCRLDIEEMVADVILYPNPSPNGIINYQTIGEEMEKLDYVIYGINGQILKTGMLFGGAGQLDAGNLEAGLYIIKFQSANGIISKRLSIAK